MMTYWCFRTYVREKGWSVTRYAGHYQTCSMPVRPSQVLLLPIMGALDFKLCRRNF